MLLGEALRIWMGKKARSLNKVYARTLRTWTETWAAVLGEERAVADVAVVDIERLEALRDDGRRSASALNQERLYLKQFFAWAQELGLRAENPVRTWRPKKVVVRREYATVTRAEEERLMVAAEERWLRQYIRVAITTGLRQGTIRQLDWKMVKGDVLEVPAKLMKQRQSLRIPLQPRALEVLERAEAGLLIPGLPDRTTIWKRFRAAAELAGLSSAVSPHDLRRTWVERLSERGTPLQTVQRLGGWKSVTTLLTHYCQPVTLESAREILSCV